MKWRGVVVAALVMGAAVSCSGQVSGPAHKKVGLWGWVKGVVAPPVTGPTGTGFWKTSFVQGGTSWVCYTFFTSGTWNVSGTYTGDLLVVAGGGDSSGVDVGQASEGGRGGGLFYLEGTTFVSGVYTVLVGGATQNSAFASYVCTGGTSGVAVVAGEADGGDSDVRTGYKGSGGNGGAGAEGISYSISGSALIYGAGGGGGGVDSGGSGGNTTNSGAGTGGSGASHSGSFMDGADRRGGGAGGAYGSQNQTQPGGRGGSGVVIVRIRR